MKPLASLLGVLVLVSCGHPNALHTAEGYLRALSELDFEGAAGYVSDEGKANFRSLRQLYEKLDPEEKKKFQVKEWTVTGDETNGDSATVDFTFDGDKRGQLSLVRLNGEWRVAHRVTF